MEGLRNTLEARQVRIYFSAMMLGALLGVLLPGLRIPEAAINPALALMLFATFMQVPLAQIGSALRNARFMAALGITNFVLLPIASAGLLQLLPGDPMLRLAVLFVLLAPCVDYVITFTHMGQGNARLLLAATPVLLLLQIVLLPLYLGLMLGEDAARLIEPGPFAYAFVWLIALPLLAAGVMQAIGKRSRTGHGLVAATALLPVPATALVLFVVLASVMPQIGLAHHAAMRAIPVYLAFAFIAPLLGWGVARAIRLEPASARALSFSASYRNSLVILPLAFAVPGGVPLIPAVILTQTMTELFLLPAYLRWIPRLPQHSGNTSR